LLYRPVQKTKQIRYCRTQSQCCDEKQGHVSSMQPGHSDLIASILVPCSTSIERFLLPAKQRQLPLPSPSHALPRIPRQTRPLVRGQEDFPAGREYSQNLLQENFPSRALFRAHPSIVGPSRLVAETCVTLANLR